MSGFKARRDFNGSKIQKGGYNRVSHFGILTLFGVRKCVLPGVQGSPLSPSVSLGAQVRIRPAGPWDYYGF